MESETTAEARRERRRDWMKSQWESNHVNLLLVFVVLIILANALFVAYQQWKFVPLKFPDARAFKQSTDTRANAQVSLERQIVIRITGASKASGEIKVSAADSQKGFVNPQHANLTWSVPLDNQGQAILRVDLESLPESFALTAFHDLDDDGQISLNSLGAPVERYGYSGDQRYVEPSVPPSFERAKISRPPPGSTIDLFIR